MSQPGEMQIKKGNNYVVISAGRISSIWAAALPETTLPSRPRALAARLCREQSRRHRTSCCPRLVGTSELGKTETKGPPYAVPYISFRHLPRRGWILWACQSYELSELRVVCRAQGMRSLGLTEGQPRQQLTEASSSFLGPFSLTLSPPQWAGLALWFPLCKRTPLPNLSYLTEQLDAVQL